MNTRQHFLPRFGQRPLHDDDWLTTSEVSQVLSENADGRKIPTKYINSLIYMGIFKSAYKPSKSYLIQYRDVRDYVVRSTVGRHHVKHPSPNTQRQRRYKERKEQQQPDDGVDCRVVPVWYET